MPGITEKANSQKKYELLWMGVDVGSTTVKVGRADFLRISGSFMGKVCNKKAQRSRELGLNHLLPTLAFPWPWA